MALFNQFSFIIMALTGGAILAVVLWRWRRLPQHRVFRLAVLALYAAAAVLFLLSQRYPAARSVGSLAELDAVLDNDRPTFVMLYSNYWLACIAALPAVRELADVLEANAIDALLLNIHDDVGSAAAERFAFRISPTYLVFDTARQEVWRGSTTPSLDEITALLE